MRRHLSSVLCLLMFVVSATAMMPALIDSEGKPIEAIRIEGNRLVSEFEIVNALGLGPGDVGTSIDIMKATLPYFERVDWRVEEEEGVLTLILHVSERPKSDLNFELTGGFNRGHGFRVGPRWTVTRRRTLRDVPSGKLDAEASYGFANDRWYYQGGVEVYDRTNEGKWTHRAEFHRSVDVRDADEQPNNGERVFTALAYGTDFLDYLEREGGEFSSRWSADSERHHVTGRLTAETHRSVLQSTRWSLFSPQHEPTPIFPVTPGIFRAASVRYDYDAAPDPIFSVGNEAFVELEWSNALMGSDFSFARVVAQGVKYIRIRDDFLQLRLKATAASDPLPLQRQAVIGGPSSVRGYGRHEKIGDHGYVLNIEYRKHLFGRSFLLAFYDEGNAWAHGEPIRRDGTLQSVGGGFLLQPGVRFYLARGLESGRSLQASVRWARMF
ncbi:MAG: BamA/TamA family outer membrane protein [Candidatus Poribacteria bacterium]|nr:BamA/TamA family outer membrane protein [Candidatus Poribacteria bacterium]